MQASDNNFRTDLILLHGHPSNNCTVRDQAYLPIFANPCPFSYHKLEIIKINYPY